MKVILSSFVYDGFDGASVLDCYDTRNGNQLFTYSNTRRGGLKLDGKFNINYIPTKFNLNVPFQYIKSEERRTSLDLMDQMNSNDIRSNTYSIRQQDTSVPIINTHIPIQNSTKKFQASFSGSSSITSVNSKSSQKDSKDKSKCVMM